MTAPSQRVLLGAITLLWVLHACGPTVATDSLDESASSTAAPSGGEVTESTAAPSGTGLSVTGSSSSGASSSGPGEDCPEIRNEALGNLERIVDGTVSFFESEHEPPPGSGLALHRCPHEALKPYAAKTPMTPSLSAPCFAGPDGFCFPDVDGSCVVNTCYNFHNWEHSIWTAIGFALEAPHRMHYKFTATNANDGFGSCRFKAQAFGQLDGDLPYSTYERSGELSARGFRDNGLFVEFPCE